MTAFDEGYTAFMNGEGDRENPYRNQDSCHEQAWLDGWCAAAADHQEEQMERDGEAFMEMELMGE